MCDVPGQNLIPQGAQVRSYSTVEKDQLVWVWMGDPALADPTKIVDFPYHNDPAHWPNKHTVYPISCGKIKLAAGLLGNNQSLDMRRMVHSVGVGGDVDETLFAKLVEAPLLRVDHLLLRECCWNGDVAGVQLRLSVADGKLLVAFP